VSLYTYASFGVEVFFRSDRGFVIGYEIRRLFFYMSQFAKSRLMPRWHNTYVGTVSDSKSLQLVHPDGMIVSINLIFNFRSINVIRLSDFLALQYVL